MDLLLQAAKVLEQEHSCGTTDHGLAKSTRVFQQQRSLRDEYQSSEKDDSFVCKDDFGGDDITGSADEDISESERRRAGGSNTRLVHNQLEKNRRKQMRECFNYLQQCIPALENKRVATQSILQGSIKYIKSLKKKNVEQEREIQMLANRKSELKRKHDIEFNKCSEEEQKQAQVIYKAIRNLVPSSSIADEDGHTSDSTTTASEGPDNDVGSSDEEPPIAREREKPNHVKVKVNPVVAAKLDGLRKRKLASLDCHPKSTEHIIASMKDAGLLGAPPGKTGSSSQSAVSSSSVALKNMLEQRKKQTPAKSKTNSQTNSHPAVVTPASLAAAVLERDRLKAIEKDRLQAKTSLPTTYTAPKTGSSSLISSHPMLSNQLATLPSLPLPIHNILTPFDSDKRISSSSVSVAATTTSFLINSSSNGPYPVALTVAGSDISNHNGLRTLTNMEKVVDFVKNQSNPVIYAPTTLLPSDYNYNHLASAFQITSGGVSSSTSNMKLKNETISLSSLNNLKSNGESLRIPFDFSMKASAINVSNGSSSCSSMHPNTVPISVIQAPMPSPASSTNILPSVIPMSLFRSLPLNASLTPMAVAITLPSSSNTSGSMDSVPSSSSLTQQNIITQKVGGPLVSEILLTSPVKAGNPSSKDNNLATLGAVASLAGQPLTALLATTPQSASLSTSIKPGLESSYNVISSIPSSTNLISTVGATNISFQDALKNMGPTLLPLGSIPFHTNSTQSLTPASFNPAALRFYSSLPPNSVLTAAPLTNGQNASFVRLGVLPNFLPAHLQVQSPQMIAQPIVVVSAPNSMMTPVDSATRVIGSKPVSSSSSII